MDNKKKYDLVVYIGRFRPFHNGHFKTVEKALEFGKQVLILVGSANTPRTIKNPFLSHEVCKYIEECFDNDERVVTAPLVDFRYKENLWLEEVQEQVNAFSIYNGLKTVALIGHSKDDSSYYLKKFPQWEQIEMENIEGINATDIRHDYFKGLRPDSRVPRYICNFMDKFSWGKDYENLVNEYNYYKEYWKWTATLKYHTPFQAADGLITKHGHVLLVERKNHPGRGLLAMPGGFVGKETIKQAAIREAFEETNIDVPPGLFEGSLMNKEGTRFDDPNRSLRGHVITHVFHFDLTEKDKREGLPKVKGADDAARAIWVPLYEVKRSKMYEDHYCILNYFGLVK